MLTKWYLGVLAVTCIGQTAWGGDFEPVGGVPQFKALAINLKPQERLEYRIESAPTPCLKETYYVDEQFIWQTGNRNILVTPVPSDGCANPFAVNRHATPVFKNPTTRIQVTLPKDMILKVVKLTVLPMAPEEALTLGRALTHLDLELSHATKTGYGLVFTENFGRGSCSDYYEIDAFTRAITKEETRCDQ